eukprot:gene5465-biopygen490
MPDYAGVRRSTPEYTEVRRSTPAEYAEVRRSTPEYAGGVRRSTPEHAEVRHSWKNVRKWKIGSICGLGSSPHLNFLPVSSLCNRSPIIQEGCIQGGPGFPGRNPEPKRVWDVAKTSHVA